MTDATTGTAADALAPGSLVIDRIETIALRADGNVAWRAAHSDVVTEARLVAGRLDLTTFTGAHVYLDARTGEAA